MERAATVELERDRLLLVGNDVLRDERSIFLDDARTPASRRVGSRARLERAGLPRARRPPDAAVGARHRGRGESERRRAGARRRLEVGELPRRSPRGAILPLEGRRPFWWR